MWVCSLLLCECVHASAYRRCGMTNMKSYSTVWLSCTTYYLQTDVDQLKHWYALCWNMTEHILLYSPACNSGFNIFHVIEGQNFHWNYKMGFCSFSFPYIFWVSYTCIWRTLNTWSHPPYFSYNQNSCSKTYKMICLAPKFNPKKSKWFVWPPNSIQKNSHKLPEPSLLYI